MVLAAYDYRKYFASFHHGFACNLMAHAGMPSTLAAQTLHLYTNMQRVMESCKAVGTQLTAYSGFGEGDVLSLFPALLLRSWQFKMLDSTHPDVTKGAYIDDQNFWGKLSDIVGVDQAIHSFDELGMQDTPHEKTVLLCTNENDMQAV